ncbi:hypothetical protein GCM10009609_26880 [Pseudonocardia aurantiaca]
MSLRAERKSPATIKVYGDGVRRFLVWCDATGHTPELMTETGLRAGRSLSWRLPTSTSRLEQRSSGAGKAGRDAPFRPARGRGGPWIATSVFAVPTGSRRSRRCGLETAGKGFTYYGLHSALKYRADLAAGLVGFHPR